MQPSATWKNSIAHPSGTEYWTATVEQANPATGLVRLHVIFQAHGESGFAADKYSRDQREDGEIVFVHGIMTKLSLQGRETTTYPQHGRYSNSLAVETSLQDPLP